MTLATDFFGRSDELDALRLAVEGDSRLLVISGPGGVGKTSLVDVFLSSKGNESILRYNAYDTQDPDYDFAVFLDTTSSYPQYVLVDGAERIRDDLLRDGAIDIQNRGPGSNLLITTRREIDLPGFSLFL